MTNAPPPSSATGDSLIQFHADVEYVAGKLHLVHFARTQCQRGCSGCCSDDLSVFSVESDAIKLAYALLLKLGTPHAIGGCAFLAEDGACRIYEHRPYVCRTHGLPMRWFDEPETPVGAGTTTTVQTAHELRDICPLNEPGVPIDELAADQCWTLGPSELRLSKLEMAHTAEATPRVALRSLFNRTPSDTPNAAKTTPR